jgi:DNA invertase Pin-like site-specific DNA recombinase
MVAAIKAGDVGTVYARSVDRIYRSVKTYSALLDLCREHGTRIVTQRDGIVGGDGSPMATAFATVGATFAQLESDTAKVRAKYGTATKRRNIAEHAATGCQGCAETRLHRIGRPRYGPETTAAVLDAFEEAGSFNGAAAILTARGIPSMLGGRKNPLGNGGSYGWNAITVARIVRRERPDVPKKCRQGVAPRGRYPLSGLLACPACGTFLSPQPRTGAFMGWYCARALVDPAHPRPYVVSERYVLPWIKEEVARLRLPDAVTLATDNAAQREALAGRLDRAHELYIGGAITRERHAAEAAAVAVELDRLGAAEAVVAVPRLDWTWAPRDVNAVLSAILERVTLGPDMRPVSAVWRVPAWRAP